MKFERIHPAEGVPTSRESSDFDPAEEYSAETNDAAESIEGTDGDIEYRAERERWAEAKAEYKEAKTTYEERLTEYYDEYSEKSVLGRGAHKLGEWWNGKPDDLTALEEDFKAARSKYAQGLEAVLDVRSQAQEGNREFDSEHIDTRTAFARRFILEPRKQQLDIEKEHLHSTETVEQTKKLMHMLQKNKWGVRVGTVAATGIIIGSGAGVAAGVAAGGARALRIAGGMVGGYYGAKIGDAWGKEGVEDAQSDLHGTQLNTVQQFNVQDIDRLESALVDAENTVDAKQRARKFKMIAGAVVGGGSIANLDTIGDAIVSPAAAEPIGPLTTPEPEPFDLNAALREEMLSPSNTMMEDPYLRQMFENNLARAEAEALAADTMQVLNETAPNESLAASVDAEVNAGLEAAAEAEAAEALAQEAMQVLRETTPVEDYTVERGNTLWGITKESYSHLLDDLPEAQQNQILDGVFDKLRADATLTTELGIGSGNIDLIHPDEVLEMNALQDLMRAELHDVTAEDVPVPEGAAVVSPDDTLWNLTKDAYTEQLQGLTETQQNQVLDGVFDTVRSDPTLTEQLGVKSGDIDLIRPGEIVHLPLLSELISNEVTRVEAGVPPAAPTAETVVESAPAPTDTSAQAATLETAAEPAPAPVAAETAADYPTGSLEARALATFGTQEAFTDAKLRLIERITGHEPGYLSIDGHQERVFSRIMNVDLDSLEQQNLHLATNLEEDLARPFLLRAGLHPGNEYNFQTLEKWFQFYRENIQPERMTELNIDRQPGMTLNDLLNEYLLATSR